MIIPNPSSCWIKNKFSCNNKLLSGNVGVGVGVSFGVAELVGVFV